MNIAGRSRKLNGVYSYGRLNKHIRCKHGYSSAAAMPIDRHAVGVSGAPRHVTMTN